MHYKISQTPDGRWLLGEDEYGSETSLLQIGVFDCCACGMPEENLEYILGALELISDLGPENKTPFGHDNEWSTWWDKHQADILKHHGSEKAAYFFYYWADNQKLTEHGGSVPGWLTDKGEEVLGYLKSWQERR